VRAGHDGVEAIARRRVCQPVYEAIGPGVVSDGLGACRRVYFTNHAARCSDFVRVVEAVAETVIGEPVGAAPLPLKGPITVVTPVE